MKILYTYYLNYNLCDYALSIGSCVVDKATIGSGSFIGAGSVVVKDIPKGVVAYGNPARVIRPIDHQF